MDKKQLALTMYVGEMAVSEIAKELEVSVPTVYSWLEARNLSANIRAEKYDEAVRMYAETDTPVSVICSMLSVSPPTLYKHVHARGIPRRSSKSKINKDVEQDILEMYQLGTPIVDICTMYSISPPVVYSLLRKHNLKPSRHSAGSSRLARASRPPQPTEQLLANHLMVPNTEIIIEYPEPNIPLAPCPPAPCQEFQKQWKPILNHNLETAINHILTDYDEDTEL